MSNWFSCPEIKIIEPTIHQDSRGIFFEAYKEVAWLPKFVQDNISVSKKGVVRGLHYQMNPFEQGKLIRCIRGSIFDVVVDLRSGKYQSNDLSDENHLSVYIPPGFAHGFQALEEDTIIHYKCTKFYSKEHETGIFPFDKDIDIKWPIDPVIVSGKDHMLPTFKEMMRAT